MRAARSLALAFACCTSCTSPDADDDDAEAESSAAQDDAEPASSDAGSSDDASSTTDATSAEESGTTGSVGLSGEQLYGAFCAACHGADANGTVLAYEVRHPDREYARWVVRNGRMGTEFGDSVMMPFSDQLLSDDDLDLVFDWLDAFPQPDTGEGLYLDYCRNCHGADAGGGVVDKPIQGVSVSDALEKAREGEGGQSYGSRGEFMSAFAEDRLSESEIVAIVQYIATL